MLTVKNLKTYFYTEDKIVKAVDDVSFNVAEGETLGIVGESGSGKSTVALSILKLISSPGKIVSGEILWNDKDVLKMQDEELRRVRGGEIGMIFQDPFSSLNPVFTIGDQIAEAVSLHQGLKGQGARDKAIDLLETVHIPNAFNRAKGYPHQWSGGMRQRAVLAMALAGNPELLIADEPTTALDVTIQAEILKLIKEIQNKFRMSVIFITHNFAIVSGTCDRVMVMKDGKLVEEARVPGIFKSPKDAYTKKLLDAIPKPRWRGVSS